MHAGDSVSSQNATKTNSRGRNWHRMHPDFVPACRSLDLLSRKRLEVQCLMNVSCMVTVTVRVAAYPGRPTLVPATTTSFSLSIAIVINRRVLICTVSVRTSRALSLYVRICF